MFREYIRRFDDPHKVMVAFELPAPTRFGSAVVMHHMIGALMLVCEEEDCDYIGVNTARMRSFMGIKANKRDVIKANIAAWARETYQSRTWKYQDEMDAALVANWFIRASR